MIKQIILLLLICIGFSNISQAQFGGFSHEVGIIAGPIAFQSDYGQRNNLSTNAGNTGMGIGLIHYLNFSYKADCNCYTPDTYFNDHFKLRTELSYNKTNLKHFGQWVAPNKTGSAADYLRSMKGSTAVTNLGMQLEYYPLSIRDFSATVGSLAPFISVGGQFSYYNAKNATPTLPPYPPIPLLFPRTIQKYEDPSDGRIHGYSTESGAVWSVVSSVGTRYKLTVLSDLMIDLRAQYFFSNWVEGLNPNPEIYKENKANDWLVWFNVGYIYYL